MASGSYNQLSVPSSVKIPVLCGEEYNMFSHLGPGTPPSLIICKLAVKGLCVNCCLLQGDTSLRRVERCIGMGQSH